ncbi:MAG: AAA family ATPase [Polyangiaceae bacterium]|nr:AAA family ATPase [Polyangiaceae bacterium]
MNAVDGWREKVLRLQSTVKKVIVGNDEIIDGVIVSLLGGSHVLLEGVPGLGKTLLVRTLSDALGLSHARIQFTPDLMPADILGTTVVEQNESGAQHFEFRQGPIFSSIVLADEVNRATPKTQSALLEAMQERQVTIGGQTHALGRPYMVLATQNPLEMEGTYPLPEAQLDRFFFKLKVPYPSADDLAQILTRTTSGELEKVEPVLTRDEVVELQELVREVPAPTELIEYAVRLVRSTHPELPESGAMVRQYVATGASPRGAQALILAAKIGALLDGRILAGEADVRAALLPALRHRLILNFEGEAEAIDRDDILQELIRE